MSYVIAAPELMTSAASDLATIASNVNAAHMVAAARTTSLIPAAADEVSAGIAHLFSQHAASYQALAGQAAAFQAQFVHNLTAAAFSYTDVEAALAAFLQNSAQLLSHPHLSVTGPIGHWFVDAHPRGSIFTPEQLLAYALIAPIYIPFLIAGEAVILPIVGVGSLLLYVGLPVGVLLLSLLLSAVTGS